MSQNMIDKLKKRKHLLLLFLLAAIFLRFFSFFPTVLDHDETTYMLIGNELTQGKKLYTDVTDTKPAAIFFVYAVFQKLFGYSIFWKRFAVALLVGLTSYIISKVSFRFFKDEKAAFAAGIIYLFYTSTWSLFGLSPNTELYFNLFTISGLLLLLKDRKKNLFFSGLLIGIGFMFKYLTLFDYTAFMLFFLIKDIRLSHKPIKLSLLTPFFLSGIGFVLPFVVTAFYFYSVGRFDDFYFITFKLPALYGSSQSIIRYLVMLGDLLLRFLPITFFFIFVLPVKRELLKKEYYLFFSVWIFFDLIAIFLPGKEFSHYTIQLMLPLSIIAGLFFHSNLHLRGWLNILFRGKSGTIALISITIVIQYFSFIDNVYEKDEYQQVSAYLSQQLDANEKVFISTYEPIIYYLLRQEVPGKYVHPTILFSDLHKSFLFDNYIEVKRIIDTNPKFVIVQHKNNMMDELIENRYLLDTTFRNNEVKVYKIKNSDKNLPELY